jgi:hypothetical protein
VSNAPVANEKNVAPKSTATSEAPAQDQSATTSAAPAQDQSTAPTQTPTSAVGDNAPDVSAVTTVTVPEGPIPAATYTPVLTDDPKWTPGAAHAPSPSPVSTGFENYTDAANDGLMDKALAGAKFDADLIQANKNFANEIAGIRLVNDGKFFLLAVDVLSQGTIAKKPLVFNGVRKTHNGRLIRSIQLQLNGKDSLQGLTYNYLAHVLCADETQETCQNATIEIRKYDRGAKGKNRKPLAKLFAVHRMGKAIVTFTPSRAQEVNNKVVEPSPAMTQFNMFLESSTYNVTKPAKNKSAGGASDILLRTWAVANGRAGYELIFANGEDAKDIYFSKSLVMSGWLVVPDGSPRDAAVVDDRSKSGREKWFKDQQIALVNADGAGILNFKITYGGESLPGMMIDQRISVTANFLKTQAPDVGTQKKNKPAMTSDASPTTAKPKRKKIKAS